MHFFFFCGSSLNLVIVIWLPKSKTAFLLGLSAFLFLFYFLMFFFFSSLESQLLLYLRNRVARLVIPFPAVFRSRSNINQELWLYTLAALILAIQLGEAHTVETTHDQSQLAFAVQRRAANELSSRKAKKKKKKICLLSTSRRRTMENKKAEIY